MAGFLNKILTVVVLVSVVASFTGINIGSHFCREKQAADVSLILDGKGNPAHPADDECSTCQDNDMEAAACHVEKQPENESNCRSDDTPQKNHAENTQIADDCCFETTDYLKSDMDIEINKIIEMLKLEVAYVTGFDHSKLQTNLKSQRSEERQLREIVPKPYDPDFLHFIGQMIA